MAKQRKAVKQKGAAFVPRRIRRKMGKALKKAKAIASHTRRPVDEVMKQICPYTIRKKPRKKKKPIKIETQDASSDSPERKRAEAEEEEEGEGIFDYTEESIRLARIERQKEMLEIEEKEIRKYEKLLQLKKRKAKDGEQASVRIPKYFNDMGLSYILDVCNLQGTSKKSKLNDSDDDDFDNPTTKKRGADVNATDSASENGDFEEQDGDENEEMLEDEIDDDDEDADESVEEFEENNSDDEIDETVTKPKRVDKNSSETSSGKKPVKRVRFVDVLADVGEARDTVNETEIDTTDQKQFHEDIYGRLVDEKGRVLVKSKKVAGTDDEQISDARTKLTKILKGNFNRLSEANARTVAKQIEELSLTYSRNDIKAVFTELLFVACVTPDTFPDRLLVTYCLLLSLVHALVSAEYSAYFVEKLALKFRELYEASQFEDKRLFNICRMFAHSFHLNVVSGNLMVDLMGMLVKNFKQHDIELLLSLLQCAGFALRKSNPIDLKKLIDEIHKQANAPENLHLKEESRTKFMLETLNAIKNNNTLKVTSYDVSMIEHFQKLRQTAVKGKSSESPLAMNMHDLWNAEELGRWWVVGSGFAHQTTSVVPAKLATDKKTGHQFDEKIVQLAKTNRMNTDLRRTIFCIIMSAEDYLDAFEKLEKLSLKDQQEREIIHVCVLCSLQERQYNPYYGLVIRKFCAFHNRYKLTTQFAIWDKIKQLDELKVRQQKHLASLMSQLIVSGSVSMAILKVVQFDLLSSGSKKLLRRLLGELFVNCEESTLKKSFQRMLTSKDLKLVFEGILLFAQRYLAKDDSDQMTSEQNLINERIRMMESLRYMGSF